MFIPPFPPWITWKRAPDHSSLGSLGPLLQHPGLASRLGLFTPPRSESSDCICSCLAWPLGSAHAPGSNPQPGPGSGSAHGSPSARPGRSSPLPLPLFYLSFCSLSPLARSLLLPLADPPRVACLTVFRMLVSQARARANVTARAWIPLALVYTGTACLLTHTPPALHSNASAFLHSWI